MKNKKTEKRARKSEENVMRAQENERKADEKLGKIERRQKLAEEKVKMEKKTSKAKGKVNKSEENKKLDLRRFESKYDGKRLAEINLKRNNIEGIAKVLSLKVLDKFEKQEKAIDVKSKQRTVPKTNDVEDNQGKTKK